MSEILWKFIERISVGMMFSMYQQFDQELGSILPIYKRCITAQ